MKLIYFLLIAFLISCIFTLKKREEQAKKKTLDLEETILSKDSLILQIQASNRIYIDKALGN